MAIKKIVIKKSGTNLTSVIISLLIVIAIFVGMFRIISYKATESGLPLPQSLNETQTIILDTTTSLDSNINNILNAFKSNSIREANSNEFTAAWNGMKGLVGVLLLPISFIGDVVAIVMALITGVPEFVPPEFKILVGMGVVATLVFLILAILKGEPGKV